MFFIIMQKVKVEYISCHLVCSGKSQNSAESFVCVVYGRILQYISFQARPSLKKQVADGVRIEVFFRWTDCLLLKLTELISDC